MLYYFYCIIHVLLVLLPILFIFLWVHFHIFNRIYHFNLYMKIHEERDKWYIFKQQVVLLEINSISIQTMQLNYVLPILPISELALLPLADIDFGFFEYILLNCPQSWSAFSFKVSRDF